MGFLLLNASPALAYSLNNTLNYQFPADFQSKIQDIEKRHGLQINIKTEEYDPDKVSFFRNAGSDAADRALQENMLSPNFDSENNVSIVWLRQVNNKAKGTFGLSPGEKIKSALPTNDERSELITKSVKPFMPGNPSKALIALADNLDKSIVYAENARRIFYQCFLGLIVGLLISGLIYSSKVLKDYLANQEIEKGYKQDKIDEYRFFLREVSKGFKLFSEEPNIFFDLKLANDPGANIEEEQIKYAELVSAYGQNLIAAEQELKDLSKFTLSEIKEKFRSFRESEQRMSFSIRNIETKLEKTYRNWLTVRANKDHLAQCISEITREINFVASQKTHRVFLDQEFEISRLNSLLKVIPLSFADFTAFSNLLMSCENFEKSFKQDLNRIQAFLVYNSVNQLVVKPKKIGSNATAQETYDFLELAKKADLFILQANSKLAVTQIGILKVLDNNNSNIKECLDFILTFERWLKENSTSLEEMNDLAGQVASRYSREEAVEKAAKKRTKETQHERYFPTRPTYIENNSVIAIGSDSWRAGSNHSSSSSHSSSSDHSSSSYSSDSSSSDYTSDSSGGGDY